MVRSFDPYINFGEDASDILMVSKGTHISGTMFPFAALLSGHSIYVMQTIKMDLMFEAINDIRVRTMAVITIMRAVQNNLNELVLVNSRRLSLAFLHFSWLW